MAKKAAIAAFLGVLLVINAEASLISFFVVETGLPEENGRNRYSEICENAFMDVFFDAGYVVSNYPIQRLASRPDNGILEASGFDLFEARSAGIDFILIAHLEYLSGSTRGPGDISLYVFKVAQYKIIYERFLNGKNYRTEREANDDFKTVARELVRFVTNL